MPLFAIILLIFGVSQVYWFWKIYRFLARRIRSRVVLGAVCAMLLAVYFVLYQVNLGSWRGRGTPTELTLREALLVAPFTVWAVSSLVAFFVAIPFAILRGIAKAVSWVRRDKREAAREPRETPQLERREFLGRTAALASTAPFVAGAYGLFYGRLNLETTAHTVRLPKLPRAFDGFRICQLSDIHIGPFMPAEQIRKYVAIANEQKAEMIMVTGDFVTFDGNTQYAVVEALSGLHAPFGVYGCLGNHDAWALVEDSITDLLRRAGVKILRGTNEAIAANGESFNLIGVDFQSPKRFGPSAPVKNLLGNIEGLVDRNRVNILMSHNPDTFDRAAELGIELSLAGHTHGGQAALEFISPEIAPSRLATPYVAGWFRKPGGRLYVNRGIGTIFVPVRIGAPPEITVYRLSTG
jgi:hypothetical protein